MASNVNWFVIWVPSVLSEIENNAHRRDTSITPSINLEQDADEIVTETKKFKIQEIDKERSTSNSDKFEVSKIQESLTTDDNQRGKTSEIVVADKSENRDEPVTEADGGEFRKWEPTVEIVKRVIAEKPIKTLHFFDTVDRQQTRISFCVCFDQVEDLLLKLQYNGIGLIDHSSISVFPCSIHVSPENFTYQCSEEDEPDTDKFYSSIKLKLLLSDVIARIEAGAEFSFDFLLLLILAGIIAFMGLMENSSVVLVASILVSPLMGPILAGIFGGTVHDRQMTKRGIRHEVYALMICIMIGFVCGLMIVPFIGSYGIARFPTPAMLERGKPRSLLVGVLIDVPIGAGAALTVFCGNAGSLVGVAISASLLPPAVNCGLYWALSLVELIGSSIDADFSAYHGYHYDEELNETDGFYEHQYSDDLSAESFFFGLVSLTLTLINILCIIITGVLILKLKKVTSALVPQKFSNVWRSDVRAHPDYYKAIKKGENCGLKVSQTD